MIKRLIYILVYTYGILSTEKLNKKQIDFITMDFLIVQK